MNSYGVNSLARIQSIHLRDNTDFRQRNLPHILGYNTYASLFNSNVVTIFGNCSFRGLFSISGVSCAPLLMADNRTDHTRRGPCLHGSFYSHRHSAATRFRCSPLRFAARLSAWRSSALGVARPSARRAALGGAALGAKRGPRRDSHSARPSLSAGRGPERCALDVGMARRGAALGATALGAARGPRRCGPRRGAALGGAL